MKEISMFTADVILLACTRWKSVCEVLSAGDAVLMSLLLTAMVRKGSTM